MVLYSESETVRADRDYSGVSSLLNSSKACLEFLYSLSVYENAEFTVILLNELPIAFQRLILVRFSIKLIHDLDAKAVHSTAMKVIEYNFGIRE